MYLLFVFVFVFAYWMNSITNWKALLSYSPQKHNRSLKAFSSLADLSIASSDNSSDVIRIVVVAAAAVCSCCCSCYCGCGCCRCRTHSYSKLWLALWPSANASHTCIWRTHTHRHTHTDTGPCPLDAVARNWTRAVLKQLSRHCGYCHGLRWRTWWKNLSQTVVAYVKKHHSDIYCNESDFA